ncbi:MAG: hypothetical protein QOE76_3796, partial [Frankiales bacterium]|nr:hypothetical protein [Frankiales bacterium]
GLRTDVTAAGAHVGYAYNGAGQLASVADSSGTTAMGYTTDGDLASVTRPNGVATAYGYDAAGRLVSLDSAKGATVVANIDYTLDAAGNRVGVSGPDGAQAFTLDADNRLTAATGGGAANLSYSYDAAGNRTSVTSGTTTTASTYDAAGRLSKVGTTAVSMDADGNLTTAGGDTYAYNAAGALTAATVGGKAATYTVNADGARVAVTTGGATSKLVLDVASDLPAVLAETGHRYTRDTTGMLLADTAGAATSFAVTDGQGTTRALTDNTGAVTGTASYDPYGRLRTSTGPSTSFGYTGATTDVGGNVNLQAREYNPAYGQFLQADTYTIGGNGTAGYNHYTYTTDNPTTFVDNNGHEGEGGVAGEAVEESIYEGEQNTANTSALSLLQVVARQYAAAGEKIIANRILLFLATHPGAAVAGLGAVTDLTAQFESTGSINPVTVGIDLVSILAEAKIQGEEEEEPAPAPVTRGGIGPVLKGQAGETQFEQDLVANGGEVIGRQVTIRAYDGSRTRVDFYVKLPDGSTALIEVKTGPTAGLNPNQANTLPQIAAGGGVALGGNAAKAGLTPGEALPPGTKVYVVHQP